MLPLGLLTDGEHAEIMMIKNNGGPLHGHHGDRCWRDEIHRIEGMGIRVGKYIEILRNRGSGPLLIKIDESRIAIGRGVAMKIFVRRKEI